MSRIPRFSLDKRLKWVYGSIVLSDGARWLTSRRDTDRGSFQGVCFPHRPYSLERSIVWSGLTRISSGPFWGSIAPLRDSVRRSRAEQGRDDRFLTRRLRMKRYALPLVVVLALGSTAWGHHVGMCYTGSSLTMCHWVSSGLCPNPCPAPNPCPVPNPCPRPRPRPCWPVWWCWPHGGGNAASSAESYASTAGPGSTAISVSSGQSSSPGATSSSYAYSQAISQ